MVSKKGHKTACLLIFNSVFRIDYIGVKCLLLKSLIEFAYMQGETHQDLKMGWVKVVKIVVRREGKSVEAK